MPKTRQSDANDLAMESEQKPKPKARRKSTGMKAKKRKEEPSAVYVERVEEKRPEGRVISATAKPKRKSSWSVVIVQVCLLLVFVAAAHAGWKQLIRVRQEAASDAQGLRSEVSGELSHLQSRLDALMQEWDRQEQEKERDRLLSYELSRWRMSLKYPAAFGQPDVKSVSASDDVLPYELLTFSANPDVWLVSVPADTTSKDPLLAAESPLFVCENELEITNDGYCDAYEVHGRRVVESVWPEYGEDGVLQRVLMGVSWQSEGVGPVIRAFADLGSPYVADRDVFAPVDEQAERASLEGYYRAILKKEGLPPVVQESLMHFSALADSVQILP